MNIPDKKLHVSAITSIKDTYISAARRNLHIGQCFAEFARFEERVSRASGIEALSFWVWASKRKGIVASGQVIIRFPGQDGAYELGRWVVREDGSGDIDLGTVVVVKETSAVIGRTLSTAWLRGDITKAIRVARQTAPI
jgi:hypothetical protein